MVCVSGFMSFRFLVVTAVLLVTVGCGVSERSGDQPDPTGGTSVGEPEGFPVESTRLVKRFTDSSVPPEYHRSHTITIDARTTGIVIDSYGDEIARDEVPTDPGAWADVLAELPDALDSLPDLDEPDDGCTGGTNIGFTVYVDDEVRFQTDEYRCGGAGR